MVTLVVWPAGLHKLPIHPLRLIAAAGIVRGCIYLSQESYAMSSMTPSIDEQAARDYQKYRSYLYLLARSHIGARHRGRLDPSDLVQQTLLEAHQTRDRFRGTTSAERMAWLKQILANNLADALRAVARAKRDVTRERPLDPHRASHSFSRVDDWLVAVQSSPSHRAIRDEDMLRLADSLTSLPALQREAVVLRYLQGLTLVEVGRQLDKTPAAVAGLLHRGLKRLKEILADADRSLSSA
jgi:RNA polymerase sigma-70 factor, ECF subfamily